jgi:hypothetical protein
MTHDITALFTTLSRWPAQLPDVLLLQQLNSVSIVLKRHGLNALPFPVVFLEGVSPT